MSSIIALELIGYQPPWVPALLLYEATQKVLGNRLFATTLQENVYGIPLLINCTPEILSFSLNGHEYFIYVPHFVQPSFPLFELASIVRERPREIATSLVTQSGLSFQRSCKAVSLGR